MLPWTEFYKKMLPRRPFIRDDAYVCKQAFCKNALKYYKNTKNSSIFEECSPK